MISPTRFPIRLKILVTFLVVITVVVSLIIIMMANLFNTDKTTYIRDLTSVIAVNVAEEADSLLVSYREKLQVFSDLVRDPQLAPERKTGMISDLFRNFPDFVAVSIQNESGQPITMYDAKAMEKVGAPGNKFLRNQVERKRSVQSLGMNPVYVENITMTSDLPLLLIAVAHTPVNSNQPTVVTALVRLDSLLRLARRPSAFQIFIVDSEGALIAHENLELIVDRADADWIPDVGRLLEQEHWLGSTIEYEHDGTPMIGGLARIESSGLLAGAQIPKAAAFLTARKLLNNLMLLALALLVATALLSVFLARRLTRPLETLTQAARQLGQGDFSIHVESSSRDEIGVLSGSFNKMAGELRKRLEELRNTQAALVQSEKMSAFGQLSAGIAHEVKNPLTGILGHAQLSLRKVKEDDPLHNNISIIAQETKRCIEIITNLMRFARQEKMEYEPINVNDVVKQAMEMMDHQLTINQVKIEQNLESDLPQINGNANQLQQVLMNFGINAQQAMEGSSGVVRITTDVNKDGNVLLIFADNGPGIPADIQDKIFEPFFTTKPAGKGTGLGLSVTYGIIKDHKGEIRIESEIGTGTAFIMTFPALVDEITMTDTAA